MKTYSVVLTLNLRDTDPDPSQWDWPALIGDDQCQNWQAYDVTEEPVERVRLTDTGADVIC